MSKMAFTGAQRPDDDVLEAAEALVEAGLTRSSNPYCSDETVEVCHVCEGVEDHADDCPVYVLRKWLKQFPNVEVK